MGNLAIPLTRPLTAPLTTVPAGLRLGGGAVAAVGAAALLEGEANGFAADFTCATDAKRVAVKASSVVTEYAVDAFFTNAGTSPKQVYNAAGTLVWSPHNMFLNSGAPVTQSVATLIVGANYTVTVTGPGSLAGTVGASGTATAGAPATFTATGTSGTFTKTGTLTTMQLNRGAVATAYLVTTAAARNGLAVDCDPATGIAKGVLCEPTATNLLLNNATLSTQSVTVTAVAHTLSFWGTGTVTLSGTSTAGPLVGTGVNNRVSLTFTPTAGSLTLTVSGTVSRAQLETGAVATSPIPTYAASATRAVDQYRTTPALINYSATAGSWWSEIYTISSAAHGRIIGSASASAAPLMQSNVTNNLSLYDGTLLSRTISTTVHGFVHKAASAFQSADRAVTADGLAIVTDAGAVTNLLVPGANVYFGTSAGTNPIHGYIRKVFYLPRRMSNAELVTKTT